MHISSFLEKFHKRGLSQLLNYEKIAEVLAERYKTSFELKNITIKDTVLFVKSAPVIKSDIFINKKQLLSTIKEKLPHLVLTDIR